MPRMPRSRNRERWENPVSSSKLIAHDARDSAGQSVVILMLIVDDNSARQMITLLLTIIS